MRLYFVRTSLQTSLKCYRGLQRTNRKRLDSVMFYDSRTSTMTKTSTTGFILWPYFQNDPPNAYWLAESSLHNEFPTPTLKASSYQAVHLSPYCCLIWTWFRRIPKLQKQRSWLPTHRCSMKSKARGKIIASRTTRFCMNDITLSVRSSKWLSQRGKTIAVRWRAAWKYSCLHCKKRREFCRAWRYCLCARELCADAWVQWAANQNSSPSLRIPYIDHTTPYLRDKYHEVLNLLRQYHC